MENTIMTYGVLYQIFRIVLLPFCGYLYMRKKRNMASLSLFVGFCFNGFGLLIQKISPLYKASFTEADELISQSGFPLLWHMGEWISLLGLLILAFGMISIYFPKK